jgi:hypothetical protein
MGAQGPTQLQHLFIITSQLLHKYYLVPSANSLGRYSLALNFTADETKV